MKTAMKLTTGILAITLTMAAGAAFSTKAVAQEADAIDQARSIAKSLQQKQAIDSNAALDAAGVPDPAKPAAGSPAPAVRPAVIPVSKPPATASAPAAKPAPAKAAAAKAAPGKTAPAKADSNSAHNQLSHVSVVPNGDKVQVEISSTGSVTPQVTKLSSPARILIEMPDTVVASAQSKISVGTGGVKGIRMGMDGKTPPTTSVVVDLEKPLAYEMTPSASGKLILTLHAQGAAAETAKNSPAPKAPVKAAPVKTAEVKTAEVKTAEVKSPEVKSAPVKSAPVKTAVVPLKAAAPTAKITVAKADAPKPVAKPSKAEGKPEPKQAKAAVPAKTPAPAKTTTVAASKPAAKPVADADASQAEEKKDKKDDKKEEDKKWAMNGKRDPFFSPVVQTAGSGCSTGKKCLDIGAINLRGVVKSDTGFIAVVTNNLNKAYFLRENDPVFNGYVMKITGDSVTFQETVQDKLGKSFTREVVKRIFTPAV